MTEKEELHSLAISFLKQLEQSGEEFVFQHQRRVEKPPAEPAGLGKDGEETAETLREFARRISGCTRCRLHKSRTNFVFGAGDPDADLMFVGEGPGLAEDRQGLPFVGASGKLLTKIIASIGFSRSDVFIGNMVKCRPPENRDPLPDEIAACEEYLQTQISMIKPKVIITLGRFSAAYFHGREAPMKELRGVVADFNGVRVVSTYHPAALLRNSSFKRGTWEDMLLARKIYDEPGGRPSSGEVYRLKKS